MISTFSEMMFSRASLTSLALSSVCTSGIMISTFLGPIAPLTLLVSACMSR